MKTLKELIVPKAKEVVVEEVVETVKEKKVDIAMVVLGVGLAIFGLGLLLRKPATPVTIVRM